MIKTALAVAAMAAITAPSAMADGFYVNPEYNAGFSGSDFEGGVLDGHIGYETDSGFYIQAGPSVLMPDGGEAEVGASGKIGATASMTERMDIYGELSVAKYDEMDIDYGLKIGGKYKF